MAITKTAVQPVQQGETISPANTNRPINNLETNIDAILSYLNGTSVEADLLNGQSASFYRNASNLNAGTIAEARLPASALVGDTTYTAGTGLTLTGTTFSLTGDSFNASGSYTGLRAQATTKGDVGLSGIPNTNASTVKYLRGDGTWVIPPNYYLNGLSFNTTDGSLTATVNGTTTQTVDLDGRYSLDGHTHNYDNYGGWTLNTDGTSRGSITSGEVVRFDGGSNVSLSYSATNNAITINATDTTYTVGTGLSLSGTTFSLTGDSFNASGSYAGLRAQATTSGDVGLGSVRNVTSYSQTEADNRYVQPGNSSTISGRKDFTAMSQPGGIADSSGSLGSIEISGDTTRAAMMCLHRGGSYATYFGLDTDNKLKVGGWSMGNVAHEIWHAGNFDPSSKANSSHSHSYLPLSGGTLTGDVEISKNNPWLTLHSSSSGTTGGDQGAGISIGEGGKKGNAVLHLTYTGDGYSHIGMGPVGTNGIPDHRVMKLYYQNNNITFYGTINGNGSGITNVDAADSNKLNGLTAGNYLRSNATDYLTGRLRIRNCIEAEDAHRDNSVVGTYSSSKTQQIWAMGMSYRSAANGSNFGSLYGLAYKHTNNGTGGSMGGSHQMVWCQAGSPKCSLGTNIWTSGNVTAKSDIRVKTDLEVIPEALNKIDSLKGYTFSRTDVELDNEGIPTTPIRQTGVVAQEVIKVLPEAVTGGPTDSDPDAHYSVSYGNLVGLLIEGIKEERRERKKLELRVDALEQEKA